MPKNKKNKNSKGTTAQLSLAAIRKQALTVAGGASKEAMLFVVSLSNMSTGEKTNKGVTLNIKYGFIHNHTDVKNRGMFMKTFNVYYISHEGKLVNVENYDQQLPDDDPQKGQHLDTLFNLKIQVTNEMLHRAFDQREDEGVEYDGTFKNFREFLTEHPRAQLHLLVEATAPKEVKLERVVSKVPELNGKLAFNLPIRVEDMLYAKIVVVGDDDYVGIVDRKPEIMEALKGTIVDGDSGFSPRVVNPFSDPSLRKAPAAAKFSPPSTFVPTSTTVSEWQGEKASEEDIAELLQLFEEDSDSFIASQVGARMHTARASVPSYETISKDEWDDSNFG
jgi:hypothetical protein